MEKFLDSGKNIDDFNWFWGFGLISWILTAIWYFYSPDWRFENDREFLELQGDKIPCYFMENSEKGLGVFETDKIISADTKLKPVAGVVGRPKLITVDDEYGNRFAIHKDNVVSYPEGLKVLNENFKYVFRAEDLKGMHLDEIIEKAGDYSFYDKEKGIASFPQIVVFYGREYFKYVLLKLDEDGTIIDFSHSDYPHSNYFTKIPYYDRIASLNIFAKLQRFSVDSKFEYSFFDLKITPVLWFFFDCFISLFIVLILFVISYFLLSPFVYLLFCIRFIPNFILVTLKYIMLLAIVIPALGLLYHYSNIWILVGAYELAALPTALLLVVMGDISNVRCKKCHRMNCIEVTKTRYLKGYDVVAKVYYQGGKNIYYRVDEGREKWNIRTHFFKKCIHCGNIVEKDEFNDELKPFKNTNEIACPKCHQYTLETGSKLIKDTVKSENWSYTKRGDLKPTGSLFGPDYTSKDKVTHYTTTSGSRTFELSCKCHNCDYKYSEEFTYKCNDTYQNGSETVITKYKKV